jgi:hypothetical protein
LRFQAYLDNLNLLSLDPVARSSVIDRGIPIEVDQYDYSDFNRRNYEESELKLSLPEEDLNHVFNPEMDKKNDDDQQEISLEPSASFDGYLMSEDLRVLNQEEKRIAQS